MENRGQNYKFKQDVQSDIFVIITLEYVIIRMIHMSVLEGNICQYNSEYMSVLY